MGIRSLTPHSLLSSTNKLKMNECLKLVDKDNWSHLEEISTFYPSTGEIAVNLVEFMTNILPSGQSTLVDVVLSEALTDWHYCAEEAGYKIAYQKFCASIRRGISRAFDYTVSGVSTHENQNTFIWDCFSLSLKDWIAINRIIEVSVCCSPIRCNLSESEKSFILARHVFNRHDMMMWGLPPHGSIGLNHDNRPIIPEEVLCLQ